MQSIHTAAALERYTDAGVECCPGKRVGFVVVEYGARRAADHVRLSFECVDDYDAAYYERLLVRACESVVSPLG